VSWGNDTVCGNQSQHNSQDALTSLQLTVVKVLDGVRLFLTQILNDDILWPPVDTPKRFKVILMFYQTIKM